MKPSAPKKKKTKGVLSTHTRHRENPAHIWGLTGGIASGKSLAARFFREAGIPVIDADQIARSLSQADGSAYEPIVQRFGTADRARLREIIFSDPKARKDLEAILHPLIQAESMRQILDLAQSQQALGHPPLVIYEATLLVETGRYKEFDGLIVIQAPREIRLNRLYLRDRTDPFMAERIFSAQAADEERKKVATHVLDNSGSPEELGEAVKKLAGEIKRLFQK